MKRGADRLQLLATFSRIAERGSISAAAKDLGMTQASASRQLAQLEEKLGAHLIHRTTHSLALTEAGKLALTEAQDLLAGWDVLAERLSQEKTALQGPLKVVAPVALGQLHLIDAALSFQLENPRAAVTWILQDEPIRFAELGCDLWLKVGHPNDDALIVREIARVERLIVAAPGLISSKSARVPKSLKPIPCVALDPFEGGSIPLSSTRGASTTLQASVAIRTNNIFSAHKAALAGIGYAVLPRWLVTADFQAGRLVDVLEDWRAPELIVTAAYQPSMRRTRRLKRFLEMMDETINSIVGLEPVETLRA